LQFRAAIRPISKMGDLKYLKALFFVFVE